MNMEKQFLPSYARYFYLLGSVVLTSFVIITMNFIISPLLAAAIIAILLRPLSDRFEKSGLARLLSTIFIVLLFCLGIFFLVYFLTAQLGVIAADPFFSNASINKLINSLQEWSTRWLGLSLLEKFQFFSQYWSNFIKSIAPYFPSVFFSTVGYLSTFLLFFISLFFFLYYRTFLVSFIYKLFDENQHTHVKKTLNNIDNSIKNYIVGLFLVICIMAVLGSMGLVFLGINHAIFFGISAAILTIIPFVGIMIGAFIPALYALATTDSLWYPIGVLGVFGFVQFLEGNFITPIIIGGRENINPYMAILGLFIGGSLLGTMGVILAIPLLGIIKIICDDFPRLKPIGYVMGNPPGRRSWWGRIIKKISRSDY